jgi:predicted HNH restriction endonuclease
MSGLTPVTAAKAGICGEEQIVLALKAIYAHNGVASIQQIYAAVNGVLAKQGDILSTQGQDSLRYYVNTKAVRMGYIHPHVKGRRNEWRITSLGEAYIGEGSNLKIDEDAALADLESFDIEHGLLEGGKRKRLIADYERKAEYRLQALNYHKALCSICGFDFEAFYGEVGKGYVEIHHSVPVSRYDKPKTIDPKTDMIAVCANCHRMLHRKRAAQMTPATLKELVKK